MKSKNGNRIVIIGFVAAFIIAAGCFIAGIVKTNVYNGALHKETFTGDDLFAPANTKSKDVYVSAAPRSSTWTKIFDFNNESLTDHNYQAYTYDFTVSNNTGDQVKEYSFMLKFSKKAYLQSAWNGSLEIHQVQGSGEIVSTIPDLRDYKPADYPLDIVTVDGESLVVMKPGDYLIYHPSSSANAMEMPIDPMMGTVPGIIMYVAIGEDINDSSLEIDYTFQRFYTSEPLFWVGIVLMGIWLVALVVSAITSAQIRYYKNLHERDNKIINESIETFTGFIDAKDSYTNGHSKRVAQYTRLIAGEYGYDEDELNRIYYVSLLHDCGKIGVPDSILGKPGKLTDEEFEIIKSHTRRGGEILSNFKSLENAGEGALYHHERYDGKGYPEGRAGEDIPFIARMICVADSFDAMNSNRCYRNKLTKEDIINELESNKGRQFDPNVADVMLRLIREGKVVID